MHEVDEYGYFATNGTHAVCHVGEFHGTNASPILCAITYTVCTIEDLNFILLYCHHLISDD